MDQNIQLLPSKTPEFNFPSLSQKPKKTSSKKWGFYIFPILVAAISFWYGGYSRLFATGLATPMAPNTVLDPACAPTDANCFVQITPAASASTTGLILSNDGTNTTWIQQTGGVFPNAANSVSRANWSGVSGQTFGTATTTLADFVKSVFFPATAPAVSLSITAGASGTLEVGSAIASTLRAIITKNTNNIATLAISASNSGTVCSSTGGYSATSTQPCSFTTAIATSTGSTITGISASAASGQSTTNGGSVTYTATVLDSGALSGSSAVAVTYQPKVYAFLSATNYLAPGVSTSTLASAIRTAADGTTCSGSPFSVTTSTGCSILAGSASQTFKTTGSATGRIFYYAMPTAYEAAYSSCYNNSATPCIKVSADGTTPTSGDSSWGRRVIQGFTNGAGFAQNYAVYAYKASDDSTGFISDLTNYQFKF